MAVSDLNFFSRPPFLAAWLFGYALLYYILRGLIESVGCFA